MRTPWRPTARRSPGNLEHEEDRRLAALAADGDEAAFEAIFERHHRGLLTFSRHLLGSQEEAEDALQHTFAAAFRQLSEHGPPEHLRAWLYATTRNRCYSMLRSRRELPEGGHVPEGVAWLPDEVERRNDLRDLLADIERLPHDQRVALVLAEIEDLDHAEVAEVLGCPREKVRALVFQARTTLGGWREARALPCREVRHELATARGGQLRRAHLRRHLSVCRDCTSFREDVNQQRRSVALLLPPVPLVLALKEGLLGTAVAGAAGAGGGAAGGGAAAGGAVGGAAEAAAGAAEVAGGAAAGGAGGAAEVAGGAAAGGAAEVAGGAAAGGAGAAGAAGAGGAAAGGAGGAAAGGAGTAAAGAAAAGGGIATAVKVGAAALVLGGAGVAGFGGLGGGGGDSSSNAPPEQNAPPAAEQPEQTQAAAKPAGNSGQAKKKKKNKTEKRLKANEQTQQAGAGESVEESTAPSAADPAQATSPAPAPPTTPTVPATPTPPPTPRPPPAPQAGLEAEVPAPPVEAEGEIRASPPVDPPNVLP